MLEVALRKRRRELLVEVAFRLEEGAALGIFGASGSGKSTVLGAIAGMESPDAGDIRLGGCQLYPPPLPLHRRSIGYLTHDPHLFPHLSVADNVAFALPRARSEEQQAWLDRLRTQMRLDDCWTASATRISAGQARRAALARMLARRPALVLLDEPFAGLDRDLVRTLIADLLRWRQDIGFSLVAVDHHADVLRRLSSRVLILHAGRIVEQGEWDELLRAPSPGLSQLLAPI